MEILLGDDLVEGEFTATHEFAGAAVTEDVTLFGDLGGPGGLAAVALTFVLRHDLLLLKIWGVVGGGGLFWGL